MVLIILFLDSAGLETQTRILLGYSLAVHLEKNCCLFWAHFPQNKIEIQRAVVYTLPVHTEGLHYEESQGHTLLS